MALIRWLHLSDNDPWQVHRRFVERMRSLGHRVEAFDIAGPHGEIEHKLRQGVLSADAFVLMSIPDVLGTDRLGDLVWDSVRMSIDRWAKRILVLGASQQMNLWLDAFDIQVSSHKLFVPDWHTRPGRVGVLRVEEQPASVSLGGLFSRVEEIRVASPWLLRTGARAQPLLVCPPETDIVDSADRFLRTGDASRVCAAFWAPGPGKPPRALVFSTSCFHDSGLDDNLALARNTIEWLVGHDWAVTVMEATGRYVADVEMALRELIKLALGKPVRDAWFERIPFDLRRMLEQKYQNAGARLEPFDYATFRDLVKVISARWSQFEDTFAPRQKREVISPLHRLVDIRNRLSHPPRARKEPPSDHELAWVIEVHEFLTACLQRARENLG